MTSDEKWKDKLTEDEFKVARQCGTEPPFSGKYYDHKEDGIYRCICCDAKLFSSSTIISYKPLDNVVIKEVLAIISPLLSSHE